MLGLKASCKRCHCFFGGSSFDIHSSFTCDSQQQQAAKNRVDWWLDVRSNSVVWDVELCPTSLAMDGVSIVPFQSACRTEKSNLDRVEENAG